MKPSVKRALSLVLSAGLLVSALAVYATLITGEYAMVQDLRGKLDAKNQLLDLEARAVEQVNNLIVNLKSVDNIRGTLFEILPETESFSSVMSQINALSQVNGLTLQGVGVSYLPITPSPAKRSFAKNIGGMRLDLKFFGSYSAGKDFLASLERNRRIMDVKNMKMESASKTGQDLLSYSLTVDTYYQAK